MRQLVSESGELADTTQSRMIIANDPGYKNISTTILTLLKMPSAVGNPITYAEELPSFDDSLKAKLLIAAMLDRTLAHDSPEQDLSEAAGGVVREWSGEFLPA